MVSSAASADEAFAWCESIARERMHATRPGEYANGYRAAGREIAEAIRSRGRGELMNAIQRDLRDAEVEARTLARVVLTAAELVADVGAGSEAAEGIQRLLGAFFSAGELPPELRRKTRRGTPLPQCIDRRERRRPG